MKFEEQGYMHDILINWNFLLKIDFDLLKKYFEF